MKSILIFGLKASISIGSLYIVSRSIAWTAVEDILKHVQYPSMILALAIFWVAQIFSALRCVYVARILSGTTLNLPTSIRAHFIGLWFNQVMPTSLGGDVIKIAILKKPLGLSIAIRSAILDRLSGLMFLLLATAITLPLYANLFPAHPELIIALGIIAIGGVLAIILSAWAAHRVSKLSSLNAISLKFAQVLSDIWAFRKGRPLWEQTWTSAIVHFNGIITYALISFALGINVDLLTFLLVIPITFLIALIPMSYAGWGLREAGAVWLFGMVGITNENALAISVCFGLLLVIAGLPGLLVWALIRNEPQQDKP